MYIYIYIYIYIREHGGPGASYLDCRDPGTGGTFFDLGGFFIETTAQPSCINPGVWGHVWGCWGTKVPHTDCIVDYFCNDHALAPINYRCFTRPCTCPSSFAIA